MNLFFRKLKDSPVFAIILCLLLAASSAATTIGVSALKNASAQEAHIDENYTTIAIPKDENSDYSLMVESPYCTGEDTRAILDARVRGGKAPSTGSLDPLRYNSSVETYPYMISVLAVTCLEVEDKKEFTPHVMGGTVDYTVTCRIEDWVSIIDAYDLPPYEDEIIIQSRMRNTDDSIPFEVGKTYLVRGLYGDYFYGYQDIPADFDFFEEWETLKRIFPRSLEAGMLPGSGSTNFKGLKGTVPHWKEYMRVYGADEEYNWSQPRDDWPYFTEYEGDWRDFLETDEGAVWRDEILPYMDMNHESVLVILSDNIDSLYSFSVGTAYVLEGRKFTDEEYANGDNVCMVSAAYAKLNGLSVGDKIDLDFYESGAYLIGAEDSAGFEGRTIKRWPVPQEAAIGVRKDYEIVGIYASPEWMTGEHSFHADTVFIPKASVPVVETGTELFLPVLHSMILENGSIEATEQYMAEKGHPDEYFYFDQGYGDALEAIATMKANGQRLMFIGTASLVIVGLLFLWLYDRRTAKIARNMRLLGVKKSDVWAQDMAAILLLEFVAVALGTVAAAIIADADIITVLAQFAALALVSGLWTLGTVNRNLMRKK